MKILAYVEPHPIRNTHGQFTHVGRLFAQALLAAGEWEAFDFRLFANDVVADRLATEFPETVPRLLRPTATETLAISAFDQTWTEQGIAIWLDLVKGVGPVTTSYLNVLRRIHDDFPFDVVLLWSENGAVRAAARELGATTVHAELGPTRAPFPPTIYVDFAGTNGNATVKRTPLSVIENVTVVPPEAWLTSSSRTPSNQRGVLESGVLWPSPEIAALLPRRPFAFVPMQLADDLNTLCHSHSKSPADFIEQVIPPLLAQGLDVVFKGHPGVAGRPYNITMEMRAFARARSMSDRVTVLPPGISSSDTLAFVAQSQIVCTINSSVGFESMLMGKSCALMGSAVYDPHARVRGRGLMVDRTDEQRRWDAKVVSLLMGHYFLPTDDVLSGEALLPAIDLIHREHRRGGDFGEPFWEEWVERMAFGWRELGQAEGADRSSQAQRRPLATASDLPHRVAAEVHCDGERLRVDAILPGRSVQLHAKRTANHFIGHIDEIEQTEDGLRVRGWALEAERMIPPVLLLVVRGATLVACAPVNAERGDVAAYLQNPTVGMCGFDETFSSRPVEEGANLRLFFVSRRNTAQEIAWCTGPLPG